MDEKIDEIKIGQTETPVVENQILLPKKRWLKIVGLITGILLLLVLVLGVSVGLPLYHAYQDGQKAYQLALAIRDAGKTQDIKKTTQAITAAKNQVMVVQKDLEGIAWTRRIPFFGTYTSDLLSGVAAGQYGLESGEIIAQAVEPYADLLGLKGQGTNPSGTAEDRIAKAVETLDKVTPQIDQVAEKMVLINKQINTIDPNRYPDSFAGKPIRSRIVEVKELVALSNELLTSARPMIKKLPDLLGTKGEVKYMILFQNDKELRPTGGFITAYAVFRVEKGRIHLETSDDIYKLDDTVTSHVAPPDPIVRYLQVNGWRLRDANLSPDFLSSMKTFEDIYAKSTDKKPISGIVAVDTHMLTSLMDVLGPVEIYGTKFTTEKVPACDCPMIIYELLKQAGMPRNYWTDNRKDMIGILLQAIMRKALDAPSEMNGAIFQAILKEAQEKHILVYLHDQDAQRGVETLGFAGRIKVADGDYLHINDANLGGAKSNLYVKQNVTSEVSISDNGASVNLTIDYRYPHGADNCSLERKEGLCLAGIYRDYLRVYFPKGAIIEETKGFENKSRTFEDLDHTAIDGYFTVVPQGLAKIQIKYRVPGDFKKMGAYKVLIQKQPGTDAVHYKMTINGKVYEFDLLEDKELDIKL